MNFECEKKDILNAIEKVILATSAKPTIPYLSNIYFSTLEDSIILNTLDMEIFMKTALKVKVIEQGKLAVNAKKFYDIIKASPEGIIKIMVKNNKIHISSPKTEYDIVIPILNDEAPEFKDIITEKKVSVDAAILKDMIKKTIFSISMDSLRYVLNGVYVIIDGDKIKMVTTDGKRLSFISKNCQNPKKISVSAIIPSKAINVLASLIQTEKVQLLFASNQVQFVFDNTILITRLIDGNYPNYEQVIPKDGEVKIKFESKKFLESLTRVAILATEKETPIKITFKDNKVVFFEQDLDGNISTEELNIDYKDKEYTVIYNPHYIIEVLKNIESKNTNLVLTSALNPAVIKPENDNDYINVIMPMRI